MTSDREVFGYDEVLVPHLRRMSSLETLTLYLLIEERRFIDGLDLTENFVSRMPLLNQFVFNIRSIVSCDNQVHLPSNEDIQRSFTRHTDYQVISYVDYFPRRKTGQCCVYTYPYTRLSYDGITNSFPGGVFKYVQTAELFDERPFEHKFFVRIAQAFPSLKRLMVSNWEPQNHKENQDLNENNRHFPIIEYPHLILLCLFDIHDDYAEQFLLDTKTCFSNFIHLVIRYYTIQRVTHNFTRDATRVNCGKVKNLDMYRQVDLPEHFNVYFPHAK